MYRIMLVDDEKWVRTALRHTILHTGLKFEIVCECSNGLEALDYLKVNPVDLVMSDIKMAVMDGLTLVSQLLLQIKQCDIIVISGYDNFTYVQHALRSGVVDYLLKPVDVDEMKICLQKWEKQYLDKMHTIEDVVNTTCVSPNELSAVEQVLHYVKSKLPGEVTLTEAAATVYLNPSYLSQLFKQRMKMNFVEYVMKVRMDEAKRLLACTSLRISEIAARLGYTDVAYFSSTFKKINELTPSEYRKERFETQIDNLNSRI
jgi:YesN/AraC family two-component response regulator